MTSDPYNDAARKSNALEMDLTASQSRKIIADKVMDWMETEKLSADRASEVIGISKFTLVAVINKAPMSPYDFILLSGVIPGLTDLYHYNLGEK